MLYTWQCKECGEKIEVIRPLSKYDLPPESDEHPHTDYERYIESSAIRTGDGYKG